MNGNFKKINGWDRIMMAITFAEAGEAVTACEFLEQKTLEVRAAKRTEKRPEIRA